MKTDFTVSVRVTLDATERVAALIERLLDGCSGREAQPALRPDEPGEPVREEAIPKPTPAAKEPEKKRAPKETTPTPETPAPEAPAAEPEMTPETPKDREARKQRIRLIMDRARVRIEGSDYKQNTTGELYKRYHKGMADTFIQIAVSLGAARPTELPASKIEDFARACDEIKLDEAGEITINTPF